MTWEDKIGKIREDIFRGVEAYKVGKYFLYVFDNRYIEVTFQKKHYKHLTGVDSCLFGNRFYDKAKTRTLAINQIFFNVQHPYNAAKKKVKELVNLDKITNSDIFIVEDYTTDTVQYKFALTNLDYTVCITENLDKETGCKIDEFFVPKSLRVKDKPFDKSDDVFIVDFIFMKQNKHYKYDTLTFGDRSKIGSIPATIKELINIT